MGRFDGFTLKKKIRDSRTNEAPWPHSSTCLFLALVVQCKRLVPSLRLRGILSRQGCTPMKAAHPFSYTPVQLHTHKAVQSFSCTPVAKVLHCSCQNVTRLTALWQKREKAKAFSFSIQRNLCMLTHYSPLRGWLPSVTLGHKHNQTETRGRIKRNIFTARHPSSNLSLFHQKQ